MSTKLDDLSPQTVVALTIFGEARGEPIEGQIAVACVIRNRVKDKRWPDDYAGVCLQRLQFSCWNEHDPTYAAVMRAAEKARHAQYEPAMLQCMWIAQGVVDNAVLDVVRGANHYHADSIGAPSWSDKMMLTAKKGHHIFYRAK